MWQQVSTMVSANEDGKMTRRELVTALGAMVAIAAGAKPVRGQEAQPTFKAVGLNCLALRVTDVSRSRDFYRKHLGLGVMREQEGQNCFMSCGNHFVALFHGSEPSMDHYCYSINDYDPGDAVKRLKAAGLSPRRTENRVYFPDPDGLTVQVASMRDWRLN